MRRPNRLRKVSSLIFGILAFLVLTGVFALAVKSFTQTEYIDVNTSLKDIQNLGNIVEGNTIETKVDGELLFMVMGVDVEHKNDNVRNGIRTDTIMLVKVDFETGNINILSIPRDSRIPVEGKLDKANHAHAYGGARLAMETIRNYTGLDIDYYAKVDYRIVKDVVDAIGGVEIDVPLRMKYDDPTAQPPLHIDIEKGLQVLDGQNSINFLRFRHSNNYKVGYPEGDVGRIKAQHMFMKELVKQASSPKNIMNLSKLVQSIYNNIDTNIPMSEMVKGITLLSKLNDESVITQTIPGQGKTINKISYYIVDEEGTQEIIDRDFYEYKEYEVNEVNQMSE